MTGSVVQKSPAVIAVALVAQLAAQQNCTDEGVASRSNRLGSEYTSRL